MDCLRRYEPVSVHVGSVNKHIGSKPDASYSKMYGVNHRSTLHWVPLREVDIW